MNFTALLALMRTVDSGAGVRVRSGPPAGWREAAEAGPRHLVALLGVGLHRVEERLSTFSASAFVTFAAVATPPTNSALVTLATATLLSELVGLRYLTSWSQVKDFRIQEIQQLPQEGLCTVVRR